MLTDDDVERGLAAPLVVETLLGSAGVTAFITVILVSVMATGSAEVMSISSIVVYDIFQAYVVPFRENHDIRRCILCNRHVEAAARESVSRGGGTRYVTEPRGNDKKAFTEGNDVLPSQYVFQ